jgi:HEAT repeat protein
MNKKIEAKARRGEISESDLQAFIGENRPFEDLISSLNNKNSQRRTLAVRALQSKIGTYNERQLEEAVYALAKQLPREKALYSRIAISECLGDIKKPAVKLLIKLLGKIGKNQETKLPEKGFGKDDFQLLRDFAARTLVKIGKPAIQELIKVVENEKDEYIRQQAIDALGALAETTLDYSAKPILRMNLKSSSKNLVTLWKVIRSLGPFHSPDIVPDLLPFLKHKEAAIRWETARSLGKTKSKKAVEALIEGLKDEHDQVRRLAAKSLGHISDPRAIDPLILLLDEFLDLKNIKMIKESSYFEVIISLGKLRAQKAIIPLQKLLKHDDKTIQNEARKSIKKIYKGI